MYSISEFAELTGYTAQTLRNWEKSGRLIPDSRTDSGHRRYSKEQLNSFLNKGHLQKIQKEKKAIGYFKLPEETSKAEDVSASFQKIGDFFHSINVEDFEIECDYYNHISDWKKLESFEKVLNEVTTFQTDLVVFLSLSENDYIQYTTASIIFNKLGITARVIQSIKKDMDLNSEIDLENLLENKKFTRKEILTYTKIMEQNYDKGGF